MERRDAGFVAIGAGIIIIVSCALLYFNKSGNVMILEPHEQIAIKAHRLQTNSIIVVVGEKKELFRNKWVVDKSDKFIIKDVSTKQLNDQARIDLVKILEDSITEKKKTSYAFLTLDDIAFLNIEHPRNNDLFHLLTFENSGKYWKHPKKKEIDKVQWDHYTKNNFDAPRERYFTIDIPEMDMIFVAYESGTRLQMVAVEDYHGIMNKGDEDTSRNILPMLTKKALEIKKERSKE